MQTWGELAGCRYVRVAKTIVHPGDVNKIRELPQQPGVVVTHTDEPNVYVWNVERQPDAARAPL